MAEGVLQKVEEQLNCPICFDAYTDPKQLQCNHIYCKECLVKLVLRDHQGLTCPNCRQVTPVPDNGVAGLQPAFQINHLLEIRDALKKISNSPASAAEQTETNLTDSIGYCHVHGDKEFELYCDTCREPICYRCVIKGSKHHSHDYGEINEAVEKCKEGHLEVSPAHEKYIEEITSLFDPMEKQVAIVKKAQEKFESRCEEVTNQQAVVKENIHATFSQLREVLTDREANLVSSLDQKTQGKLKNLEASKDRVDTTLAQLNSCLLVMRGSIKTPSSIKEGTLMDTVRQTKELLAPFPADMLEPNTEADIEFDSASADITAMCRNHGRIFESGSPDPTNCHVTSKHLEVTTLKEKSTATLHVVNKGGKPCEVPDESLDCEIESLITHKRDRCSVQTKAHGQYEISYTPSFKGRHQLHVKVDGQQVKGSPLSIAVTLPIQNLGTPLLTIRKLNSPTGIVLNRRGELIVTESSMGMSGGRVSVFSPSGEKLRSFGPHSYEQMDGPEGVTIDGDENILVADSVGNCIQKFTSEGQFLVTVGRRGEGPLQFRKPTGIVFNPTNNKVYVTDTSNNRIQVLNSDLTFSSTFDMNNSEEEDDKASPRGIACDSTGKVYVAAYRHHCIQVFTAEGKFSRNLKAQGWKLRNPYGIAIDASDRVYVSKKGSSPGVSVFTREGHHVTSFGDDFGYSNFSEPCGIAVDSNEVVYVCDYNCVIAF